MFKKYLACFLISMVPLIELRGGVPIAVGMGLDYWKALAVCVVGNMLPVPIIFFFARRVLEWGADKPVIGKIFTFSPTYKKPIPFLPLPFLLIIPPRLLPTSTVTS